MSIANVDGYKIQKDSKGINMLTNKKSVKTEDDWERSRFTITEIEVWGVTL
jgi:hypothetical protein